MYSGYGLSYQVLNYDWGQVGEENDGNSFFGFSAKTGKDIFVKNSALEDDMGVA